MYKSGRRLKEDKNSLFFGYIRYVELKVVHSLFKIQVFVRIWIIRDAKHKCVCVCVCVCVWVCVCGVGSKAVLSLACPGFTLSN